MNKMTKSNTNLLLYLLGRFVSDVGTSIQLMIIPLYILDMGGSTTTVGISSFLSILPALIVYPFAGVLGDRLNRKAIMVVTDLISGGVILFASFLTYTGNMNLILLLTVQIIISLLNGLFEPATRGMLTQLVKEEELTGINSKIAALKSLSYLLGPVLGSALYVNFGITILFLINGISFLISGMSEMFIKYSHGKHNITSGVSGIYKDLVEGIKFIHGNKLIQKLCYFLLITYFVIQPVFGVILPLLFQKKLDYPRESYGILQTIIVAGMLMGSISINLLFKKEKNVMKPMKLGNSILIIAMIFFEMLTLPGVLVSLGNSSILYFVVLSGTLCIFSGAHTYITIPLQTIIQKETPDEYMARVFSLVAMISRGGAPFGALVYGIFLDFTEIYVAVGVSILFMLGASALLISKKGK